MLNIVHLKSIEAYSDVSSMQCIQFTIQSNLTSMLTDSRNEENITLYFFFVMIYNFIYHKNVLGISGNFWIDSLSFTFDGYLVQGCYIEHINLFIVKKLAVSDDSCFKTSN